MFVRLIRNFAYKPSSRLEFTDNKALLTSNSKAIFYNRGITSLATLIPSALFYRIVANWQNLGSLGFFFSTAALLTTSSMSRFWFTMQKQFVYEVYLYEDGKTLEIHSLRLWNSVSVINISDILKPDEHPEVKAKMMEYSTYLIETTDQRMFYFMPESVTFYPDVLKEIVKGNEIEVEKTLRNSDDEDFIDV
jgi:hypothetical protein